MKFYERPTRISPNPVQAHDAKSISIQRNPQFRFDIQLKSFKIQNQISRRPDKIIKNP